MATARSIVARDDTLLGICFAIGQDFGFNPLWLRILFAAILFWSPAGAVALYAVLGLVVAFSRWLAPDPLSADEVDADASDRQDEPFEDLPLAA